MKQLWERSSWAQRVGYVFGAVYVLVGAAGFIVTTVGSIGFFATEGKDLILFEVNPLHNIIHLAIGVALVLAARASAASSRLMNAVVGGVYALVAAVGFVLVQLDGPSIANGFFPARSELNIIALNHPDNFLHLASALVLIVSAVISRKITKDAVVEPEAEQFVAPKAVKVAAAPAPVEEDTGEHDAVASRPAGEKIGGDVVPRTGTYKCACGAFVIGIKQGREFPECPEPTGTDDDHYFVFQRPAAKAAAKPAAKKAAPRKAANGARPKSAASRGSRR